jgi:hypothetical protein
MERTLDLNYHTGRHSRSKYQRICMLCLLSYLDVRSEKWR